MGRKRIIAAAMALTGCMLFTAAAAQTLIPGGQSIGVAVKTGGVVVTGVADLGKYPSPARSAGIRSGDVITDINGRQVTGAAEIAGLLRTGQNSVTYERGGHKRTALIVPIDEGGKLYLGAYVRDGAAGVGTMTYYDPADGTFGALGHPVTDADAGIVLPVTDGSIYENTIIGVEKGKDGEPGEILGQFFGRDELGEVMQNSEMGIFGVTGGIADALYPEGMDIATRHEVHPGKATLITTVDENGVREFDCEITRIESYDKNTNRSFMLRVTDDRLMDITGGIVQGMSGSPIIQNGKLIGAVTHVLVNDPTRGYGIFIENMLEAEG